MPQSQQPTPWVALRAGSYSGGRRLQSLRQLRLGLRSCCLPCHRPIQPAFRGVQHGGQVGDLAGQLADLDALLLHLCAPRIAFLGQRLFRGVQLLHGAGQVPASHNIAVTLAPPPPPVATPSVRTRRRSPSRLSAGHSTLARFATPTLEGEGVRNEASMTWGQLLGLTFRCELGTQCLQLHKSHGLSVRCCRR